MSRTKSPLLLAFALWFAGLGAAGQFAKVGVIFDVISQNYADASKPVLGLLVSGVGFAGLVFGSTAGILIARSGIKRIMVVALAAAALFSFADALLPSLYPFLGLRILEGFSHLAIVVCGPVIIAEAMEGSDRAFAMTLWSTFFAVCFALMAWAGRPLVAAYGIPSLFAAHGVYMLVMAVWMQISLPPDVPRHVPALSFSSVLRQHAQIYASPRAAAPALGFMFYTLMYVAILALLPPMTGAWQGFVGTAVPLTSIAASMTLGVWMINRYPAVLIVQIGFALSALAALLLGFGWNHAPVMLSGALLLAAAAGLVQSASFAAIAQLNDTQEARSAATGAIAQLGNVGTTSGTPILATLIAAYGVNGLGAFVFVLSLGGIAMHAWLKMRRG